MASDILQPLKEKLPYILRFETARGRSRMPHPELSVSPVVLTGTKWTARTLLCEITKQLPPGWQATRFPGWLILYKENRSYEHGTVLATS